MNLLYLSAALSCLIFLILQGLAADPASAEIRIRNDMGGDLGTYMQSLTKIRESGERVVIDGDCFSACTLVTAMIPAKRLCVTYRARLGFHAAKVEQSGRQDSSPAITKFMLEMYPAHIRSWLEKNGGLSHGTLVLSGPELRAFYPLCE
jgi:hypothetical protein